MQEKLVCCLVEDVEVGRVVRLWNTVTTARVHWEKQSFFEAAEKKRRTNILYGTVSREIMQRKAVKKAV